MADGGPTNPGTNPESTQKADENANKSEKGELQGGACSSSDEDEDSENEHYDEAAQAVKFKVIDVRHTEPEGGVSLRKQQTIKTVDPHKMCKIETRKLAKPKH